MDHEVMNECTKNIYQIDLFVLTKSTFPSTYLDILDGKMSFVKNKLKVARDALGKKDFVQARDAAAQVLEYEPDNYNGCV